MTLRRVSTSELYYTVSNGNSDAEQIVRRVTETTGIVPHIAKPGLKIEFNKTAF